MITRRRRFVKGEKTFFSVFSKKVRSLRTRDTIIGEKAAGYAAKIPVAFDNGAGETVAFRFLTVQPFARSRGSSDFPALFPLGATRGDFLFFRGFCA